MTGEERKPNSCDMEVEPPRGSRRETSTNEQVSFLGSGKVLGIWVNGFRSWAGTARELNELKGGCIQCLKTIKAKS